MIAVGLVSYSDDPRRRVFRKVYQTESDPADVLDDPKWITEGCDRGRSAVMVKVAPDDPRALRKMTGLP